MAEYQQINDPMTGKVSPTILRRSDNAYIPDDPGNRDRQIYVQWCEAGHKPDAPDKPPAPPASAAAAQPAPNANANTTAAIQSVVRRIEAIEARLTHVETVIRK